MSLVDSWDQSLMFERLWGREYREWELSWSPDGSTVPGRLRVWRQRKRNRVVWARRCAGNRNARCGWWKAIPAWRGTTAFKRKPSWRTDMGQDVPRHESLGKETLSMRKWIRVCSAVVALVGLSGTADAGLFGFGGHNDDCGAAKSCGCSSDCQPDCCKPTITRPCHTNTYTYQRKCSDIKPPCCDSCGAPATCCAPAAACCAPDASACNVPCGDNACGNGGNGCAPACAAPCGDGCGNGNGCAPACAAPCGDGCGNGNGCAPACDAPCGNGCAPACDAPCGNGCGNGNGCAPVCDAPCGDGCGNGCGDGCGDNCGVCCDADPCEIAKLIYASQTACYAKDRRKAIHKLGDNYSCVCNPEIMSAFIYALNDADEDVRWKAADEIGDQLRKNPCCCCSDVVAALTCALADCDKGVRKQAEEGLEACGYEIVDGCCDVCGCGDGCGGACGDGCGNAAPAAPAAPANEAAPAPAPPEDPKAYFPSRLRQQQVKSRRGLSGLFGLLK